MKAGAGQDREGRPVGRRVVTEEVQVGVDCASLCSPLAHELFEVFPTDGAPDPAEGRYQLVVLPLLGERLLASHSCSVLIWHSGSNPCGKNLITTD